MSWIKISWDEFLAFKSAVESVAVEAVFITKTNFKYGEAFVYARTCPDQPTSDDISAWVPYGEKKDRCDLPMKGAYSLGEGKGWLEYQIGDPRHIFHFV